MKRSQGFTIIEVIVVIIFLGVATTVLFMQKNNIAAMHRDDQRKTAINAMYYNLEEVYYEKNGFYPEEITDKTLTAIDPALLKDPSGFTINDKESTYRYEGNNCSDNKCRQYTLRGQLEKEADFVKESRKS